MKYKIFSQQPSQAEGMYGSTIHTSGTSATPVRNGRPSCPEKGCSFSSAQTPGEKTQHKATGHHLLNKDHQPGDSSTLQYREGHGWCLPGLPRNQLPSDLRFSFHLRGQSILCGPCRLPGLPEGPEPHAPHVCCAPHVLQGHTVPQEGVLPE